MARQSARMTTHARAALLLLALIAGATPAPGGNLWPPRLYDQGVFAEWDDMLRDAAQSSASDNMPRYLELMHNAMHDAIRETRVKPARHASADAAAAQAAHDVLVALFPDRQTDFDHELAQRLNMIQPDRVKPGVEVGRDVALRTLAWAAESG